jgi:DNA-binding LacI/PurR family transcriptional regulator
MSIVQVAKTAGVSLATVSRVINKHGCVSDESIHKVSQAIKLLNYNIPDRRRGPKTRAHQGIRTENIAVLLIGMDTRLAHAPVMANVIHGISDKLAANKLNMTLAHVNCANHLPPSVLEGRVDGILMEGVFPSAEILAKICDIPKVWFMTQNANPKFGIDVDEVCPDEDRIGFLAADYLTGLGFDSLAFLNSEPAHVSFSARRRAFMFYCNVSNVKAELVEPENIVTSQIRSIDSDIRAIEQLAERFLKLSPRPCGIFVPSDMQAATLYQMLSSRGIKLGKDVIIVSCNNEMVVLAGLDPKPASIDIGAEIIGKKAVEQLIWRIKNPDEPRIKILVEPRLERPVSKQSFLQ